MTPCHITYVDNHIWGGGDNLFITPTPLSPPLAWGYTPPPPRIPPHYRSECQDWGDNSLDCGNKIFIKKMVVFGFSKTRPYVLNEG